MKNNTGMTNREKYRGGGKRWAEGRIFFKYHQSGLVIAMTLHMGTESKHLVLCLYQEEILLFIHMMKPSVNAVTMFLFDCLTTL